jgi:protein-tyrosine-phosphatase
MMIALERIGDYAVTIARESVQLTATLSDAVVQDLSAMSELARETLDQAMKAFNEEDEELAWETMKRSRAGRESFHGVFRNLLSEGEAGNCPLADLFALQIVFNRLERIADLAKNICEEAVFVTTGETKRPKIYRVLFLDKKNRFRSVLARVMAEEAYPESGHYECAGWEPAAEVDLRVSKVLSSRGVGKELMKPQLLDADLAKLSEFHVIVNLEPKVAVPISDLPFRTVLLDWSIEVELDEEHLDDASIEKAGKELARRIQDLMETLRGETAS